MAYQLYLYKEFSTKSGNDIRLEIFERDYSGSQIEIDDLASSPVSLITDNASNDLTNNIIKSSVIINLVDTEQVDYTRLFTSDATKFKVVVKINGVTEWTGYLTPDSFYQPLTYRNIIQLTARDNLGMLSEFVYQEDGLASISSVISAVLDKISFGCTLEYRVKKVDGNGTNIVNGLVNRTLFFGKNYEEVLSIILGGIGCQMRFVGANKYAVFDVADLDSYGEAGDAQDFFFTNQSGNLELVPAWKDLQVRQDYATTQEVLTQRPKQSDLVFVANKTILTDYDYNTPPVAPSISIPTYTPFGNNWVGTLPILSPYEWGYDKNTILLTKMSSADFENTLSYPSHIEFFKDVPAYNNGIKITFNVHNLLMIPDYELFTAGKQVLTDRSPILGSKTKGYGIIILYNIFLVSGGVTYRLGETWEVAGSSPHVNALYIDEAYKDENKQQNGIDIPCEINILSLQAGGQLQFHLYGYYIYGTLTDDVYFDFIAKISEFKFQLLSEEPGSRESLVVNNDNFNIKGGINLSLGQVPTGKLNSLSMLGGIYQNTPPYYPPMIGFKRTGGVEMHLSEQIGREYLNLRKQQRISLSGTIMTTGLPDFGKSFTYKGKNYSLNYGSLDYESEQMQVELIEAESYTYEDYTFIDAEVDTGTGSLGSGATEFIQWSSAGNAKRIYELDTASEAERAGGYVIIDKEGLSSGKKVLIGDLVTSSYSKAESDLRYLKLTGGTVTGDLTLKNAKFNNTILFSPDIEDDVLNLRRYGENHTILNIMAPPQEAWGKAREATLALVRGDGNEYFLDLYNMDYGSTDAGNNLDYGSPVMGLRLQKRATGVYTPFRFEYGDGTNILSIMQLLPHTSSGSTNNSFVSITNRLTIGYGDESKTQALAVNGAIDLTGTLTGTNATFSSYVNALGFALGAYAPYGYRFYQNDSSFAFGMYGESGIYKLQAAYQGTNSYTDFTRGFRVFNTTDNYEEFYTGKGRLELTRVMNSSSEFYSFDNGIKLDKAVLSFYQLSMDNGYARVLDIGAFGRTDSGYYGSNAESIIRFLYNTTGAYSGGVEAARFWRGSFLLGFTGANYLDYKLAVNGGAYISGNTIIGGNFYGYGIGSFSEMVLGASFKTGNWKIIPVSTTQLQIQYNDVMMAKLDSAGNILATGGVTAYAV